METGEDISDETLSVSVMRVSASLCVLLVTVRTSSQANKDPATTELDVDCRFWKEPKQSWATMIVSSKKDKEGSVFYFWDSVEQECSPCRVCPERTLSDCSYVTDAVCVSQREWSERGLERTQALDLLESRLRSSEQGQKDEGVVILRATADRNDDKVEGSSLQTSRLL